MEEDRGRNMMNTIRAATAIVIRIMAPLLFGRDCAWCVKSSVEVIGCSPVADLRTQIERAVLRRYFSLGKKGYDCRRAAKHPAKTTRQVMKLTYKFPEMTPEKRPQDPSLDGTGLIFETLEHSGESFRSVSPDSPLHGRHCWTRTERAARHLRICRPMGTPLQIMRCRRSGRNMQKTLNLSNLITATNVTIRPLCPPQTRLHLTSVCGGKHYTANGV
jgi:hypothetical protein